MSGNAIGRQGRWVILDRCTLLLCFTILTLTLVLCLGLFHLCEPSPHPNLLQSVLSAFDDSSSECIRSFRIVPASTGSQGAEHRA